MKNCFISRAAIFASAVAVLALLTGPAAAQFAPKTARFPDFDQRSTEAVKSERLTQRQAAKSVIENRIPSVQIEFDKFLGSPRFVHARDGFLTGPDAQGRALTASSA